MSVSVAVPLVLAAYCLSLAVPINLVDAADFSGPVDGVLDGDTIEVLHNQQPERIRLSGIDCPEKGQASSVRIGLWKGSHASDSRHGLVRAHPSRCPFAGWN